jgi:hypothetical protein
MFTFFVAKSKMQNKIGAGAYRLALPWAFDIAHSTKCQLFRIRLS